MDGVSSPRLLVQVAHRDEASGGNPEEAAEELSPSNHARPDEEQPEILSGTHLPATPHIDHSQARQGLTSGQPHALDVEARQSARTEQEQNHRSPEPHVSEGHQRGVSTVRRTRFIEDIPPPDTMIANSFDAPSTTPQVIATGMRRMLTSPVSSTSLHGPPSSLSVPVSRPTRTRIHPSPPAFDHEEAFNAMEALQEHRLEARRLRRALYPRFRRMVIQRQVKQEVQLPFTPESGERNEVVGNQDWEDGEIQPPTSDADADLIPYPLRRAEGAVSRASDQAQTRQGVELHMQSLTTRGAFPIDEHHIAQNRQEIDDQQSEPTGHQSQGANEIVCHHTRKYSPERTTPDYPWYVLRGRSHIALGDKALTFNARRALFDYSFKHLHIPESIAGAEAELDWGKIQEYDFNYRPDLDDSPRDDVITTARIKRLQQLLKESGKTEEEEVVKFEIAGDVKGEFVKLLGHVGATRFFNAIGVDGQEFWDGKIEVRYM